jgi:hypothetical protein
MKYKVTGLIVCAIIVIVVIVFSLSCEKNPVAPEVTSEETISEDPTLKSTKTRWFEVERDLSKCCNDQLSSIKVNGDLYGGTYVVLYRDYNYNWTTRDEREFFIAEDPNFDGWLWRPGNAVGNDKVSSVMIVNGASCTLYENSGFRGRSITLTASCPDLRTKGFDNIASSIKVNGITAWGVVLYENDHAGEYGSRPGRSETIWYNDSDLRDNYLGNDRASMIKCVNIGGEQDVILYKDINYKKPIYGWW